MSLSPRQSSLGRSNPYRYNPAYRMHYPIEGTIAAIHLPAEQGNLSKREVEYDVQPVIVGMGRIKNVPLALGVHGVVDAEEVLLRPMSLVIPDGQFDANTANPSTTDGDRVLVQFINGSFLSPVITHVLTHNFQGVSDTPFDGKTEVLIKENVSPGYPFGDGSTGSTAAEMTPAPGKRFRHSKLNGTHCAVDSLGNIFVNFKEHPDANVSIPAGSVTKKLVIQNEGVDLLRIEKLADGTIDVALAEAMTEKLLLKFGDIITAQIISGASTIALGGTGDCNATIGGTTDTTLTVGDGAKKVTIADALKTFYNTIKAKFDAFDAHIHQGTTIIAPPGGGPCSGVTGAPTPTISAPAWDTSIESTKVTIPDG